jgi:hypothetical protein
VEIYWIENEKIFTRRSQGYFWCEMRGKIAFKKFKLKNQEMYF